LDKFVEITVILDKTTTRAKKGGMDSYMPAFGGDMTWRMTFYLTWKLIDLASNNVDMAIKE